MKLPIAVLMVLSLGACGYYHHHRGYDAGPGNDGTVLVCHKGKKTLEIPRHAADAHINHGDRYGRC